MKKTLTLVSFFLLACSFFVLKINWKPVPGAKVNFTIDGMFGIDVNGTIGDLTSIIEFYPESLENSNIQASIKPATINTGNKKRDKHLRNEDFFDVEKFLTISFASKSFRKVGEYYIVEGDLTLKDVTRPVTIPFEFITNGDSAVFRGDFNINRLDYHLGKKSIMMGNKVDIHLDIPVTSK